MQSGAPKLAASVALQSLQIQGCDFLRVQGNMDLIKFLDKNAKQGQSIGVNVESVQFSDSVLKINKRDKQQKRDLIITTANVYNFKEKNYKTCQRAIPITQLKGIVVSSKSEEVLIQVRHDYDYRLLIVRQADAIRILCELYEQLTGTKLPVEIMDDLSKVQVLKSDVRKFKSEQQHLGEEASPHQRDSHATALPHSTPNTPHSTNQASSTGSSLLPPTASNARSNSFGNLDGFNNSSSSIEIKPSCEGWLTKKGQVNLLWRRRYFRLSESNLLYYEARLKGTIELVEGGEVRAWVNKRMSAIPTGGSIQTHSNSIAANPVPLNTTGGIAPVFYEYKLSAAYNIDANKHLKDILLDPERFSAFVTFCETKVPDQLSSISETSSSLPAHPPRNESGNAKFYAAVEKYKSLVSGGDAVTFHALQLKEAQAIYNQFLSPTTDTPINAPTTVKKAIQSLLARQSNAATIATTSQRLSIIVNNATSTSSSTPTPSSSQLNADIFNILQTFVLEYMQHHVLPSYLVHSKESESAIVKDFKLKNDLTEQDKLKPSCYNCLASFGLLKRRHVCKYCGDVFCSNCLTKSSKLPPEYGIKDEIKVCDMCFGSLEISHQHPHAFSYANKSRARPINLAASSPQELQSWMQAFRACITIQQQKVSASPAAAAQAALSSKTCHKEGWLMKEDPTTKIWRRRYFILNSNTAQLYYYELNLKGSLSLAQGAGVHATSQKPTLSQSDSSFGGLNSLSNFSYRFNISYNTRLYALSADTEDQMERWIEALQRVIRRAKPGAGGGLGALLEGAQGGGGAGAKGALNASPMTMGNTPGSAAQKTLNPTMLGSGGQAATPNSVEQYTSSFQQKAPEGEVTFVFTDVQNSTKLWELAPEAMNKALEKHDALLRMLLTIFKGYEVKTEGDAFMVTFFNPLDAVRWCLACQEALLENEWPEDLLKQPSGKQEWKDGKMVFNGIRIRMGIHFGHPACRRNPITGRMDYFGGVVNRSARVSDSAHGGEIVCTAEVRERILQGIESNEFPNDQLTLTDLGTHRYKGISEEVQVYQIHNQTLAGRNPFPPLRTTKSDEGEKTATAAPTPATTMSTTGIIHEGDEDAHQASLQISIQSPNGGATVAAGVATLSPQRPSHLTVDSVSGVSIHPYTPTGLGGGSTSEPSLSSQPPHHHHHQHHAHPSGDGFDSDTSDYGSDEDEEEDEDERLEKTKLNHDPTNSSSQTPDPSVGFMSPSPQPSPNY